MLLGIVLINNSNKDVHNLKIQSNTGNQKASVILPVIRAHSTRKVIVPIDASTIHSLGEILSDISIWNKSQLIDQKKFH